MVRKAMLKPKGSDWDSIRSNRALIWRSTDGGIMATPRDKFGRPIVVVTGMGIVTSLGGGKTDNWAKLVAGESGIKTVTRFPIEGLRTTMAGTIDFIAVDPFTSTSLSERIAEIATEEALAQSGIGNKGDFPGPLFLAVAPVETEWPQRLELGRMIDKKDFDYYDMLRVSGGGRFAPYHDRFMFGSVAKYLAENFGTKGSPISLSTACASGATAIQLGVEAIRRGEADAALCVATDGSVNPEAVVRFSLLSALSTQNDPPQAASKPFSKNRDGFVMAEGAGALVLESYEAATARGATILGVVAGCGELTDSFHRTRSSPDGKPIIGCMRKTLADAGMEPEQIDHINAHGTATPENDKMEYLTTSAVFGEQISKIPVSSNKSMVGHTISAAGAVEAIFSLLTLEHQRIPPTINYEVPDPSIHFDVVGNKARDARVTAVMSNSFGFGGQNASLILTREPA
jgi:3-oxoacyl-[acyl-carrier-protein] synthase II